MNLNSNSIGLDIAESHGLVLSQESIYLMAIIEAQPGFTVKPLAPSRSAVPSVLIYKVFEKMFAIVSIRGADGVILKCDAEKVMLLREQYEGIGHRSHLDSRFWISVSLDADVPIDQIERLVEHSYEQVCAKLTKKQKRELLDLQR